MYGMVRPSKVGNSHLVGLPSGRVNGIVNPNPPIFQSPCKSTNNALSVPWCSEYEAELWTDGSGDEDTFWR
jgi:hypothetical protein